VVLEEFNLASLEHYLSSVLIAATDPGRRLLLPGGTEVALPTDTFFIATCNSYLEEPETRLRLTFASKRRCSILMMENVLYQRFIAEGNTAITSLFLEMIAQEAAAVEARLAASLATSFDRLRATGLGAIHRAEDLSSEFQDALVKVCAAILSTPSGQVYLTLALLKSMALAVALNHASPEAEIQALRDVIAEKLIHQVRGPKQAAKQLRDALAGLPNLAEVDLALEVMESGPGDELLPIV
jgi:hypothetical protein